MKKNVTMLSLNFLEKQFTIIQYDPHDEESQVHDHFFNRSIAIVFEWGGEIKEGNSRMANVTLSSPLFPHPLPPLSHLHVACSLPTSVRSPRTALGVIRSDS